jgi:hypothetical protein
MLGGLIAFTAVPPAMSQWLPPWVATRGDIRQSLEAQGYVLIAPLHRRPFVYLADVSAGPAGYQRLVIDARSGAIVQRFISPARRWGPQLAERGGDFFQPPPGFGGPGPGGGFSTLPNASPAGKSAYGGPANVHIPAAISPFGSPDAPSGPRSKSAPTVHNKVPPGTTPFPPPRPSAPEDADSHVAPDNSGAAPPDAQTPLAPATPAPPVTPAEAATPNESAPSLPEPTENLSPGRPKTDSTPTEVRNAPPQEALTQDTPQPTPPAATPDFKPDTRKSEAQPEAQTEPNASAQPIGSSPEPTPKPAPESDAAPSEKSKVSIVPGTLAE